MTDPNAQTAETASASQLTPEPGGDTPQEPTTGAAETATPPAQAREHDGLSDNPELDETMAFLEGLNQPQPEASPEPEATGEAPEGQTEEAEEPAATEETPDGAEIDEEAAGKPQGSNPRIRLNPKRWEGREKDFAAIQLADKLGLSLEEAKTRLFGDSTAAPAAATKPGETPAEGQTEAEAQPVVSTAETLDKLIAEKRAERELKSEWTSPDYDMKRVNQLSDEIAELVADKKLLAVDAKREKEQATQKQQEATSAFQAAFNQSAARVQAEYPDAFKDDSPLAEAMEDEVARIQAVNPAFFNDPEWLELLAPKVAKRAGIAPAAKSSVPAKPSGLPGAAKPRVVPRTAGPAPASGAKSPLPASPATTAGHSAAKPETLDDVMSFLEENGDRIVSNKR